MTDSEIESYVKNKYKDTPGGVFSVGYPIMYLTGKDGFIEAEIAELKWIRDYV